MRTYTYEDIVRMRKMVLTELAKETATRFGQKEVDESLVGPATVEDRLRTYLSAGLLPTDLSQPRDETGV